jgi:hypothetical protein
MEIAIPLLALGSLYVISNQSKNDKSGSNEGYRNTFHSALPNVDVADRNFNEADVVTTETDLTSKLSTVNRYDNPHVYTDKFFDPSKSFTPPSDGTSSMATYKSLTGQAVDADYFRHNNMQPFFGSKVHTQNASNATESTLDNYTGSGSQTIVKREMAPMFQPGENVQWAFGTPNTTDFIKSRMNPSLNMANVKPFQQVQVAPGIGLGYTAEGSGGYNSGTLAREMWTDKTVDQLRALNNPKPGGIGMLGYEGPANSYNKVISTSDAIGRVEKNRVERAWEMGPDRLMTTTGIQKGETLRTLPLDIHSSRMETTQEYAGGASSQANNHYLPGEYMESTNQGLGAYPLAPAGADGKGGLTDIDYGLKSGTAYPNNRVANHQDTYFGALGGNLTAVVAPLLDILRPSRRENTVGNLRPYQNAKGRVESSYVYDPNDRPAATIRETTELSKQHHQKNANQHGGAYLATPQQAIRNERDTTTDIAYTGNAGERGRNPQTYESANNQRNNDMKSSTVAGYTTRGNMSLLNSDMNMSTNNWREKELLNSRAVTPAMPAQMGGPGRIEHKWEYEQRDRNEPDLMSQLKANPYALSVMGGL